MVKKISKTAFARSGVICALVFVAGCGGSLPKKNPVAPVQDPVAQQPSEPQGDPREKATYWLEQSLQLQGAAKLDALLNAVQYLQIAGGWRDAGQILEGLATAKDGTELPIRYRILQAQQFIAEGRNQMAVEVLPTISREMQREQISRILLLRGVAQIRQGDIVAGLNSLVARGQYFPDTSDAMVNLIWREVVAAPAGAAEAALYAADTNPVVSGWLGLFAIMRSEWREPERFEGRMAQWRAQNSGHPAANKLVPQLLQVHSARSQYPSSVALLLPMSGRYASAGEAVRDGFMAAYYEQPTSGFKPIVTVYDTVADGVNNPQQVVEMYNRAVSDGAQIVIGPLQKEAVQALAEGTDLPVPTLALNYLPLESQELASNRLLQFGLSPELEAAAVAKRASQDGHSRALMLLPETDWGYRVGNAFSEAFVNLGGSVVGMDRYNPKKTDYSQPIRRALLLLQSRQRHDLLERVTGAGMQVEPRRRQDVDFVFMAGFPRQARILRPQLKFHRAGKLPIYATSHIYEGRANRTKDADLNGVKFPDMSWVLQPSEDVRQSYDAVANYSAANWQRRSRLYALGVDAYRLVPMATPVDFYVPWYMPGATGSLSSSEDNKVQRALTWAEFQRGIATVISE